MPCHADAEVVGLEMDQVGVGNGSVVRLAHGCFIICFPIPLFGGNGLVEPPMADVRGHQEFFWARHGRHGHMVMPGEDRRHVCHSWIMLEALHV